MSDIVRAMKRAWLAPVLLTLAPILVAQQSAAPPPGAPSFEVVSIKINNSGHNGSAWSNRCSAGRWSGKNVSASTLITSAYDILDAQVQGIPAWDRKPLHQYDIVATCPANATADQTQAMLQTMLAHRFGFVAHFETRNIRVRTLDLAKGGAKLKPASGACVQPLAGPVPPEGAHLCGVFRAQRTGPNGVGYPRNGLPMTVHYQAWSATTADFIKYFGRMGRLDQPPLVDETGLTGKYDFDFHYDAVLNLKDENGKPVDQSYRLYDALDHQLGLIFNQTKLTLHPLPVLVIDHITPATSN